jgi:hypothetical protein
MQRSAIWLNGLKDRQIRAMVPGWMDAMYGTVDPADAWCQRCGGKVVEEAGVWHHVEYDDHYLSRSEIWWERRRKRRVSRHAKRYHGPA